MFLATSREIDRGDALLDRISIDWRCGSHGGKGDGDDVGDLHDVWLGSFVESAFFLGRRAWMSRKLE